MLQPASPKRTRQEVGVASWVNRPSHDFVCQHCGKTAQTRMPHSVKYCTNRCNWKARRELGAYDKEVECVMCEARFVARPNRGKKYRQTCSRACSARLIGLRNSHISAHCVAEIRRKYLCGMTQLQIAKHYNMSQNAISSIVRCKSFAWVNSSSTAQHMRSQKLSMLVADIPGVEA